MTASLDDAALLTAERLLRLCEETDEFIALATVEGALAYLNAAGRAMLGIAADADIGGYTVGEFIDADELAAVGPAVRRGLDTESRWEGRLTLRSLDGRAIPVWLTTTVRVGPAGLPEYVSSVGRELTLELERAAERDRLAATLEATTDLVSFHDLEGRAFFLNDAARRFFGLEPGQRPKSRDVRNYLDLAPDQVDEITAAIQGPGIWHGEITICAPDGTRRPASVVLITHLGPDGEPRYFSAITRDISERKAAEQARSRSESALRAIVQSSPLAIYSVDRTGRIDLWNRACEDLFGWTADEAMSRAATVLGSDEGEVFEAISRRVFDGETVRGVEIARWHKNGTRVEVNLSAAPIRDDEGRVVSAVAVIADVTDRKRTELALRESEIALRASESRYRAIIEEQTELVCRYLPDTTLTFVNRAFAEYYGGAPEVWIGQLLIDVFPPEDRDAELARLAAFGPRHLVAVQEDWEPRHDGSIRWYQWTDSATLDESGAVVEFQSVGRDVHDRLMAARLTACQTDILEMVVRGDALDATLTAITSAVERLHSDVFCSVMLVDESGRLLRSAASAGLPAAIVEVADGIPIGPGVGSCGAAAALRVPVVATDVATDPRWVPFREIMAEHGLRSAFSTPLLSSSRQEVFGTLGVYSRLPGEPSDDLRRLVEMLARLAEVAIERKRFETRLSHQSSHDPLTGLPNRTLFLDRLGLALARSRRNRCESAIVFLDLDGFKVVNDGLGHDAGDELLVAVGQRLEDVVRPGDTVARFGGDEFVVLCEDLERGEARARATDIATRLSEVLAPPFVIRGTETFIGASIGIALASTGDERPEDLLRDADAAMYEAKDLGKQRVVVFDDALRQRALSQHATFNALHRAIDRGELRVFYQPLVSLTSGRCIGAEALVRWQHPERGLVLPGDFIAIAEQSDLIVRLGEWVLEAAVQFAATWAVRADEPFTVSVNLAARQLAIPDLAGRVAGVLRSYGLPAERLCLEITESVLMRDADATVAVIDELQALGVKVSIDDFGTGYSSLAYLKRFPVDSVKIDRSFVDGLPDDPGDVAIVTAVVSLAHALGLSVVAEGVETAGQLAELVRLGCDQAQGYYFARPQPVADPADLVAGTRTWRPRGIGAIEGERRRSAS